MTQYHAEFTPKAEKFLSKIKDSILLKRIFKKIELLESNPRTKDAERIQGSHYFRVRVSDYRIIYTINDEIYRVTIVMIGHRRDIYEKFN